MAKKTAFDRQRAAKRSGSGSKTGKAPSGKKVRANAAASAKKGSGRKTTSETQKFQVKETVGQEVRDLIGLLVMLLLLLSICLGSVLGKFGLLVHEVSVGIFGIAAYLFCIAGIAAMVLRIWKRSRYSNYAKVLCMVLLIVSISVLMHIINGKELKTLKEWYAQATWYTGGVVGGFLGSTLLDLMGNVGGILLLSGIIIICLVVITEKSAIETAVKAWKGTRQVTRNVEENVREKVKLHQEQRRKWEEEHPAEPEEEIAVPGPRIQLNEPEPVKQAEADEEIPQWLAEKMDARSQEKAPKQMGQEEKKASVPESGPDLPLVSYEAYSQRTQNASEKTGGQSTDAVSEPAVKKADPVTKAEQEKINFGIQQNLFAEGEEAEYQFPSIELLNPAQNAVSGSRNELYQNAQKLERALLSFGVEATVTQVNQGPAVTRYELIPKQGVKVSRIVNLADDIALNLAAKAIRIEAPIPGKSAVGIEVPNKQAATVTLREIIESDVFRKFPSKLAFSLGKTIDGEVKVTDIAKMPHLLIAGATGSGKSVCINSLLISILYKAHPKDVKLILIDPKVVELSVYNGIPHLLLPVVNDPKKAAASLNWAVQEMTVRYKKFADMNVRDIKGYNEAVREHAQQGEVLESMPQIVIVIDELADLMMVAGKEVEEAICRLAQMARAAGMHLVIATQRPSVDVITGVIKANIPSRLAFAVSSGVDSKTILDTVGAEKLLGRGDMLFQPIGEAKAVRIQGAFVSDHEVERVVEAVKQGIHAPVYNVDLQESVENTSTGSPVDAEEELDEYLADAIRMVVEKQRASISMLQRAFRIGFNRAARLIDAMYERGIVGPDEDSKPRKVLMTKEEYESQGVEQDEQL